MGAYEVSQGQYLEFLNDLKSKGEMDLYNKCYPDSVLIKSHEPDFFSGELYLLFFHHPSMINYPVSGITHDAAKMYCDWLTEKYNLDSKRKFKKVIFRLPSSAEWENAARGGRTRQPFPWGGPYLRNRDGNFLANFRRVGDERISVDPKTNQLIVMQGLEYEDPYYGGIAGGLNDRSLIKYVIDAYYPNDYGLFNMSGNVAEMLLNPEKVAGGSYADTGYDIQVTSRKDLRGPANHIGFRVLMQVLED